MAGYLEGQTVKKSETEMDDILVYMQMSSVLSVAADWETKKPLYNLSQDDWTI